MRNPTFPVIFVSLTAALALRAQEPPERPQVPSASAALASEPPTIDGRLDDAAWKDTPILSNFVQREPVEGEPVSQRTEIRLVHDESALYVGAWMFVDDPSTIVVGETRRDASLDDTDAFLMVIDTYLDRQNGFVFGTTPAGIEYDGQVTRDGQGGGGRVRLVRVQLRPMTSTKYISCLGLERITRLRLSIDFRRNPSNYVGIYGGTKTPPAPTQGTHGTRRPSRSTWGQHQTDRRWGRLVSARVPERLEELGSAHSDPGQTARPRPRQRYTCLTRRGARASDKAT